MNTPWIARVVLASILVYASAIAFETVAASLARPRRWLWLGALMVAIGLPALAALAPASMPAFGVEPVSEETVAASTFTIISELPAPAVTSSRKPPERYAERASALPIPTQLWIIASAALLLTALSAAARLAYLRRRAHRETVDGVDVLVTRNLGPLVTGLFSPAILIPSWVLSAGSTERRLILAHEQQHIEGGDHWLVPLGALLAIVMPWNPAVWMMYARFRLAIETDCDARVISTGVDQREYGAALIRVAGSAGAHTVLSPAWNNRARQLEHRVRAMTADLPQQRVLRSMLLGAGAIAMIAVAGDAATPDDPGLIVSAPPSTDTSARRQGGLEQERPSAIGTPGNSGSASLPFLTGPSSSTPTHAIVTRTQIPAPEFVRVNGFTRSEISVRVHFDGEAARLVVISGRMLRTEGDTLADVVTPAVFVVEGAGKFRLEAVSIEPTEVLEIVRVRTDDERRVTFLSTGRGTRAILDVIGNAVLDTDVVRLRASVTSLITTLDSARVVTKPPAPATALEPGEIRVTNESGGPMQVQVRSVGRITIGARSLSATVNGPLLEASTPFTIKVAPNEDFSISFSARDSTEKFLVEAHGGTGGYAFGHLERRAVGSAAVCWRVGQTAAIGPGGWGLEATAACAKMGVTR
jgi:beta-lactamase regulating signal transducer with metallopeptidase domain